MTEDTRTTEDTLLKVAAAEAGKLLAEAIDRISARTGEADPATRLFFPNGIELIDLEFKAGPSISIVFKLAGPKAAADALTTLHISKGDQ